MKKTPKFQPYTNHLGFIAGLSILDSESNEPIAKIPMTVSDIDEMKSDIDTMMCLTTQFPPIPKWFTLEDETPAIPIDPFKDKEYFFSGLGDEAKKATLWVLSVYNYDLDSLLVKHLELTEEQQGWVNYFNNKRAEFIEKQAQYEIDIDIFKYKKEIAWRYYYVTLILDLRNTMFGF